MSTVRATSYQVLPTVWHELSTFDRRCWILEVSRLQEDNDGLWLVKHFSEILTQDNTWEFDGPAAVNDAWIKRHCFSRTEALARAQAVVDSVELMGVTAAQAAERYRAQQAERSEL